MTETEEKEVILRDLEIGRYRLTFHSKFRQDGREIMSADIQNAARNWLDCFRQKDGTWKVQGPALDGNEITIVAGFEDGTVVITVY
jgi:hypothetical protein